MIILAHRVKFVQLEMSDELVGSCTHCLSMEFHMYNACVVALANDELADFCQDIKGLADSQGVLN